MGLRPPLTYVCEMCRKIRLWYCSYLRINLLLDRPYCMQILGGVVLS
jgi:hypothetical protein